MAISLTTGGIPCQEIALTLVSSSIMTGQKYSASLPIGVISSLTTPDSSNLWSIGFDGTCLILKQESVEVKDISGNTQNVLTTSSFNQTSAISSFTYSNKTRVFLIRLE